MLLAKGQTVKQMCKQIGMTDQTYYKWRREYGGRKVDQARRLGAAWSGAEGGPAAYAKPVLD